MTHSTIHYRTLDSSDIPKLANLISKSWEFGQFSSEKTARHIGYIFLYLSLANQEFAQVALSEDDPVGLIMGRGEIVSFSKQFYYLKMVYHLFLLVLTKEGRKAIPSFKRMLDINKNLMKKTKKSFDGELTLFVVDSKKRKMGIGSTLFDSFIEYQKSIQSTNFFLYTNTISSYHYYEEKNMSRVSVIRRFIPFLDKRIEFFVYEGSISND